MSYSSQPADKVPETTQKMWEAACADFEHAEILLKAARGDPSATPDIVARREQQVRTRKGICNAINFLITNASEINVVIESKKKRRS